MLVDAAKHGDVEIPVFCYEPKLGEPVGACRMCLVEIEGTPKLQTACSTPVRDGMVVYTQTDQVKEAQSAVVEFLLVNHPLDCPVCDKGGECPLQDIAMGWGPGRSRFTDPKRHFQKPLPLSPLIAIDRERCILCYRCVRFSQEVSEDSQLQLLERGDRSFVGTFDDRPYVAPFHGNITELCPVGALTSYTYRFRARPWDIEQGGSVCTLCPSQCNVAFTVRDEQVQAGAVPRQPRGRRRLALRQGALLLRDARIGRADHGAADPRGRRAARGELERGDREGGGGPAGGRRQERLDRRRRLERGGLSGPAHRALGARLAAPRLAPRRRPRPRACAGALAPRALGSTRSIDDADALLVIGTDPLHAAPILDLRIRKAVRRNGAALAVAGDRPTALDGGAQATARYAPGGAAAFLADLLSALAAAREGNETEGRSDRGRLAALGRRASADRLGRAPRPRRERRCHDRLPARPGAGPRLHGVRRVGPARRAGDGERPRAARGRGASRQRSGAHRSNAGNGLGGDPRRAGGRRARSADPLRRRPGSRPSRPPPAGRGRCARRSSSSPSRCSRTPPPHLPTSCCRCRATLRRRAPSHTPTAACSGCAQTSWTRARYGRAGRFSASLPRPWTMRPGSARHPRCWRRSPPSRRSTRASARRKLVAVEFAGRSGRPQRSSHRATS